MSHSQENRALRYPGGKNGAGVYQTIINRIPPHRVYIEPFLGSGAVMRRKVPAVRTIGIDAFPGAIANFADAARGIPHIELINGDGIYWLATQNWNGDEVVYCDPPYLPETRTSGALYACEMTAADHTRLLSVLLALPCRVLLSGYWSEMYADALAGWWSESFQAMTRGGPRTEWLWMNFSPPIVLHDYRYIGRDFRERERIKRKVTRWRAKLTTMPPLERQAMLQAMNEFLDASTSTTMVANIAGNIAGNDVGTASPRLAVLDQHNRTGANYDFSPSD